MLHSHLMIVLLFLIESSPWRFGKLSCEFLFSPLGCLTFPIVPPRLMASYLKMQLFQHVMLESSFFYPTLLVTLVHRVRPPTGEDYLRWFERAVVGKSPPLLESDSSLSVRDTYISPAPNLRSLFLSHFHQSPIPPSRELPFPCLTRALSS